MIVTVEKSGKTVSQSLKAMVHREAPDTIRDKLREYLRCLKEGVCVCVCVCVHACVCVCVRLFNLPKCPILACQCVGAGGNE